MENMKISHFEGLRLTDELVIYTEGQRTGTNCYGIEAAVVGDRVVSFGSNNKAIPSGGFVVSGHGHAAEFIEKNLCEGARVTVDRENLLLECEIDGEARRIEVLKYQNLIRGRLSSLKKSGDAFDEYLAVSLIDKSDSLMSEKRFDEAKATLDTAYAATARSRRGEVRGVWHRPNEQNENEVEQTVSRLADAGFNLIFVETNYEGYSNTQKCVYDYLPLREEYAKSGFDVIESFISAGKRHGVQIHAWLEDFFFGVEGYGCKMAELHPELMARTKSGGFLHDSYNNFYFLNPALDETHTLLLDMYRDLLDNYDFDGIELDYIRYPYIHSVDRSAGFETQTKEMFKRDTGIDADAIPDTLCDEWKRFIDWRADRVTAYVEKAVALVNTYRRKGRNIQLSTAVVGNPNDAINSKCQNWLLWSNRGWLDFISPMAYLRDAEDVGREVGHMVANYGNVPNVAGISPMYSHLAVVESTKQVEACRAAGAAGVAFFESRSCSDEQIYALKLGVFRER